MGIVWIVKRLSTFYRYCWNADTQFNFITSSVFTARDDQCRLSFLFEFSYILNNLQRIVIACITVASPIKRRDRCILHKYRALWRRACLSWCMAFPVQQHQVWPLTRKIYMPVNIHLTKEKLVEELLSSPTHTQPNNEIDVGLRFFLQEIGLVFVPWAR